MKAPVPRFVRKPLRIADWIGQAKTEIVGVRGEPSEGRTLVELDDQRANARRCDVDRAAGVMFAESGRRADRQDRFDRLAGVELAADDFGLAFDAAERRDDKERDAVSAGRRLERPPGCGGGFDQLLRAAIIADFGDFKAPRLLAGGQAARGERRLANAELVGDLACRAKRRRRFRQKFRFGCHRGRAPRSRNSRRRSGAARRAPDGRRP